MSENIIYFLIFFLGTMFGFAFLWFIQWFTKEVDRRYEQLRREDGLD